MKLSQFAIMQLSQLIKDYYNGKTWVAFFNSFGARDIYDDQGLPDIGKQNGQRPSKSEYINDRLSHINDTYEMQQAILKMAYMGDLVSNRLNEILQPEKYSIENIEGDYVIVGDVTTKTKDSKTEAHFQDIQNQILNTLSKAKVSITIVMAWFTNDLLAKKNNREI